MLAARYLLLLSFLFSFSLYAQERFIDWHTEIELQPDRTAEVTETIEVAVEGNIVQRGITRTLPQPVSIIGVERDGRNEPYRQDSRSGEITIYAGEQDVLLDPGTYTYRIRYRIPEAVKAFKDRDEFSFNLIGAAVDLPIERLVATLHFAPASAPIRYACYTGSGGGKQQDCTMSRPASGEMTFTGQGTFGQGRVLSVGADFAPGSFAAAEPLREPSDLEKYGSLLILLFGGIWGAYYAYDSWRRHGVDPPSPEIQPHHIPPRGSSPASLAYLSGTGDSNAQFTASLLSLAMAGYVEIIPEEEKSFFGTTVTYSLRATERPPSPSALSPEQRELYKDLFAKRKEVQLSPAYDKRFRKLFDNHGAKLRELHYNEMTEGNQSVKALPLLGILLGTVVLALLTYDALSPKWVMGAIIAFGVVSFIGLIVYLVVIRKPTPEWVRFQAETDAFREYLQLPERKRSALSDAPEMNVEHYETLLPYAIALGIHTEWTEYFADLLSTQQYRPHFVTGSAGYNTLAFTDNLSSTVSTSTTSPSDSSGSSFSSGGGSAGGGSSGGGGAGGW
jgi:uncharacterized membrane protein YgcG